MASIFLFLLMILFVGVPFGIYILIQSSLRAKEMGDHSKQWFIIWIIVVLTFVIFLFFSGITLHLVLDNL